ncbi:MAG TPA: molybdopterin-synthase adenylyltransferase MoeB [Actinomycetota bacterium]|nr:molybdopterin-synthase adenylyltransferase MoeB [Actinomycetota bacterium]
MRDLSEEQVHRYARHIILPEVGGEGQRRLMDSKVLVVGAGGLGSPVALYLAAAGVGTLGLVDDDLVELTNLQRQILHGTSDIGRPKVESGRDTIAHVNPEVEVRTHLVRLGSGNAMDILAGYDLVVDGSDNFPTRYLANDAARMGGLPLVTGAIFQFEGQVTVFDPRVDVSPCYRCLFPNPPPPGSVPNCAQAGVFGVLAGVVGCIQATEAIKVLTGIGRPLVGSLLLYDALEMSFTKVRVVRDERCPLCGPEPSITSLIDYEHFCGVNT